MRLNKNDMIRGIVPPDDRCAVELAAEASSDRLTSKLSKGSQLTGQICQYVGTVCLAGSADIYFGQQEICSDLGPYQGDSGDLHFIPKTINGILNPLVPEDEVSFKGQREMWWHCDIKGSEITTTKSRGSHYLPVMPSELKKHWIYISVLRDNASWSASTVGWAFGHELIPISKVNDTRAREIFTKGQSVLKCNQLRPISELSNPEQGFNYYTDEQKHIDALWTS
jgi:hypothetical protein